MPNIRIREKDFTAQVVYDPTAIVVYVPGLTGSESAPLNTPTLCTTESEFIEKFGGKPATLTGSDNSVAATTVTEGRTTYKFTLPSGVTAPTKIIDGDKDTGYIYARNLLKRGIHVLYEVVADASREKTVANLYKQFCSDTFWNRLSTLTYNIKYITSGGYPTLEFTDNSGVGIIVPKMLDAAKIRGDAVALIDYIYAEGRTLSIDASTKKSVYDIVQTLQSNTSGSPDERLTYGALFMPYASYSLTIGDSTSADTLADVVLPGSAGYLLALAQSCKNKYPDYLAIAGVTKGVIPELKSLKEDVTPTIANEYNKTGSKISINCITSIRNASTPVVWSNRTLAFNKVSDVTDTTDFGRLPALSLLNLRVLTCDIKKLMIDNALNYSFENNSDILWLNYKSRIEAYLDKLISNNMLYTYTLQRVNERAGSTLKAQLTLYPVQPVENWDIEIMLKDDTSDAIGGNI